MKMCANLSLKKKCMFYMSLMASLGCLLLSPITSFGAVIFQNNFDSSPDTYTGSTVPPGWDWWNEGGGTQGTVGGVTHWSGEISSPGRGGSGKSLKMWRAGTLFEDYTGALPAGMNTNFNPTSNNFYVRWTMKLPSGIFMDFTNAGANYQKLFRLNTNGGGGEIYFNINTPYTNQTIPAGAALQVLPFLYTDPILGYQTSNYTLLAPADFAPLFDGQWHSYEVHFNTAANTLEFWLDGVLKHRNTNLSMSPQAPIFIQHFGIGNRASGTVVQSSWQAWEFDDLVIADAYIGPPTGTGGSTDTTPPTVSLSAPSSGATLSGSTTVSANASDNVGVAGVQFKLNGNNLGAEVTSSPYSSSWDTTSVSNGTHTLTATARDAAGNTTTSSPVTVTVSNVVATAIAAPTVSLTASPASIASSQSSTLAWSSTNTTSCTASGGWTGTKTTSGTQSVSPTSTTNYTLSCTGTGGTAQQMTTVTVTSATPAPTVSLAANPATITVGQSSTLSWSSTNATSCTASGSWTGTQAVSGSQSVSPTMTSTYTLTCTGTGGSTSQSSTITVGSTESTTFFSEGYEDTNFAARGWYDITLGTVDTAERHSGNASLRCTYNAGANNCTAPNRHKFTESDSVYLSYWVKYSSNFVGSGVSYHPHEFYFLTNLNGDYDGLAFDYLTLYLESHWNSSSSGMMQVGIQDGQNIDQTRLNQNLIGVTENRAVAGCNGSPSGYSGGCYDRGDGVYVNGVLLSSSQTFTTANKSNWNHVEAYYQLNSISNGIGQANGIIRVWFNDSLVFERTNAILRTGQRPTMKLNQLIFAPWIGDGSPVTQTFWVDDLVVASARPGSGSALAAPTNLRIAP